MFGYTYFIKVGQKMVSNFLQMSSQFIDSFSKLSRYLHEVPYFPSEKKETIIEGSERLYTLLEGIIRRTKAAQALVVRAKIILHLLLVRNVSEVARLLKIGRKTVRKWRDRWCKALARLKEAEEDKQCTDKKLSALLENVLRQYRKF